jgi:hypothetical protein
VKPGNDDQAERRHKRRQQAPGEQGYDRYIVRVSRWSRALRGKRVVECAPPKIRFAIDSPLEESGFEQSVPP